MKWRGSAVRRCRHNLRNCVGIFLEEENCKKKNSIMGVPVDIPIRHLPITNQKRYH
jgi:hypothetical protein